MAFRTGTAREFQDSSVYVDRNKRTGDRVTLGILNVYTKSPEFSGAISSLVSASAGSGIKLRLLTIYSLALAKGEMR